MRRTSPVLALALALILALPAQSDAGERPASRAGLWQAGAAALHASPAPGPVPVPAPGGRALPDEAACIAAILDAEREFAIGGHLLLAMGLTESGRTLDQGIPTVWPWTVNAAGEGRFFATRAAATAHVRGLLDQGVRSIDVGCLQVNLRWHPDAFPDLDAAFDPAANARYAARFLADLGRAHGGPRAAVARYHSSQSDLGDAYRTRVEGNRRWVAGALDYLEALADGPPSSSAPWARAGSGRLAFLTSLYADGPARPLLPRHGTP